MKFEGKEKEYIDNIIKYIEILGGKIERECPGGSIYCSLDNIKQIRISDHIALKGDINRLDIIVQKNKNKFVCIYYRNIVIYDTPEQVSQFIENINFAIHVMTINAISIGDPIKYEEKIDKLKDELKTKDNKLSLLNKKVEKLENDISSLKATIIRKENKIKKLTNNLEKTKIKET